MRVKICGVKTVADALAAVDAGTDALGLNFHLASPRFVEIEVARQIMQALPPFVTPVAVLVNPDQDQIARLWQNLGIVHFQLHEADLDQLLPAMRQWHLKALPGRGVKSAVDVASFVKDAALWTRDFPDVVLAMLVDAQSANAGVHGGTGQTAPWQLLASQTWPLPLILAGGLTPDNVAEAIRIVQPYAVDVASGVESAPGVKDAAKMGAFVRAARGWEN